ncbi:MAG TPA: RNA polymerase sigma factor [Acidimicrobiia bacterium]|nr:RNA polymerase sigma factor [Acidimicrobiia bacterium]
MLGEDFARLLAAARDGDDAGFAALWRELQPPLLRYLTVAAGDAAEDLASETWIRVARDLASFDGDEQGFRSWVFTIARHRLLDWRRHEGRRRTVARPLEQLDRRATTDPAGEAMDRLATDAALALIARLPSDQAEVVTLRAVAGLDVAAVARVLGKRPGAVRVLAHRGLHRLAELLAVDATDDPNTGVVTP